jgi:hypothetical protein
MATRVDGWHRVYRYDCNVENGRITRVRYEDIGSGPLYAKLYKRTKHGGHIATPTLKTFRASLSNMRYEFLSDRGMKE